jgi:hypothetical protein
MAEKEQAKETERPSWFQVPEPEPDGACRHWISNPAWCAICTPRSTERKEVKR